MVEAVTDSVQDATHDGSSPKLQNKILLKAVTIELAKPQRKKSTLSVTFGDRREKQNSEQKMYSSIRWEPGEAWDVTNGGIVMASWKSRCPLRWSRNTKIDVDKVLHTVRKGKSGAGSGPDGTCEYDHVYEVRTCTITMKFNVQADVQPKPLPTLVKSMKEDTDKMKSTRTRLGSCITYLEGISPFFESVKEIHPAIGVTIGLLSAVINVLNTEDIFNQAIIELIDGMCDMVDYVIDVNQFATIAQLKTVMEEANTLVHKAVEFFKKHKQRGGVGRALAAFSSENKAELEGLQTGFTRFKGMFDRGISVQTIVTINKLKSQIEDLVRANDDDKVLEVLDTGHQTRALRCLKGTRKDVISFILKWVRNIEIALNILWIHGYPGAGKSALAMHIANLLRISHRLGVIVEFNRNTGVTAITLWKSIAYALAREYRECRNVIVNKIRSGSLDLTNATSRDIFNKLVIEPLQQLTTSDPKISQDRLPVIIIDALDEAGGLGELSEKARREVLDCLADWSKLAPGVKLIITSRAEQDIGLAFSEVPHEELELSTGYLVTMTSQCTQDIQLYLRSEFKNIAYRNRIEGDWPGDEIIADLARRAQGVFIWATTVLSFIDGVDPVYQLKTILDGRFPEGDVHGLYQQILNTSFPSTYVPENFVLIVGVVVVLQKPFTRTELARLLGVDPGAVNGVCKGLRTLLDDGDVIQFKHQSFVDFLTQPTISPSDEATACPTRFHINISDAHDRLYKSLFRLMHKELHFNICNIPSSFMRNDELPQRHFDSAIGRPLAYACRFWSFHSSNTQSKLELDLISTFIHEDLLFWIESMSGLNFIVLAHRCLVSLMQQISYILEEPTDLKLLVEDAIQFIRHFKPAITWSAAHVYLSAIPFSPRGSRVSQLYSPRFQHMITLRLGQLNDWPPDPEWNVFHGHDGSVHSVAFAPDGKRVVSGSNDKTIRIWETATKRAPTGMDPIKAHTRGVTSVAYSPDGRRVVSGSFDKTVRLWDVDMGKMVLGPLKRHDDAITTVVFTLDGKYVISASDDQKIWIWDAKTGSAVRGPLTGHHGTVECIALSPDKKHFASGSSDRTIQIREIETGNVVVDPLEGHEGTVWSVCYSPKNEEYVVSGSDDQTVRIWNVQLEKGRTIQAALLTGHRGPVYSVTFSPVDENLVVSGSDDRTIRVWDTDTKRVIAGSFNTHRDGVLSVKLSTDGKKVISGSFDGTIRIWEVDGGLVPRLSSGQSETTTRVWDLELDSSSFDGHKKAVYSIAFSPDGKRLVSGSIDSTIRIWDVKSREAIVKTKTFKLDGHSVYCVAFSPDNRHVASGSTDNAVRVWDVETGEVVGPMAGHDAFINSVDFSPDGSLVVSSSMDNTIRIWNAKTGQPQGGPFVGHYDVIWSAAFSTDGNFVASGSVDKTVRVWNIETRQTVVALKGHSDAVTFVAYSPCGNYIASASSDNTIRIWGSQTGEMILGPLQGHEHIIASLCFSPDGRYIVSGSYDRTVRVWDVKTGKMAFGPFYGHSGGINWVTFFPDGRGVASCSDDSTIRIWELRDESSTTTKSSPINNSGNGLFTDNCTREEDGWVKDGDNLLFWIPPHNTSLCWPSNSLVIGEGETDIDCKDVCWGERWTECYKPL